MHACTLMDLFLSRESAMKPVDTDSLIRQGKNVRMIAQITLLALEAFQMGELKKFDALVGEEACQLRAKKILDLYESKEELENEITSVVFEAKRVDQLFEDRMKVKRMKKITFSEAFGTDHLIVSTNIRFIVLAYLLTRTKHEIPTETFYKIKDRTNLDALTKLGITQSTAKQIHEAAQIQLASLSVAYVRSLNGSIPERKLKKRLCVPCFDSVKTLLHSILEREQKFLIEVKLGNNEKESFGKIQLLYAPNRTKTSFEQLKIDEQLPKTSLIVFAGNCLNENQNKDTIGMFIKQIGSYAPEDLILANSAQHSSYAGGEEDPFLFAEERQKYINFADKKGCKPDNMRLFCLDHIYASTLEKELQTC